MSVTNETFLFLGKSTNLQSSYHQKGSIKGIHLWFRAPFACIYIKIITIIRNYILHIKHSYCILFNVNFMLLEFHETLFVILKLPIKSKFICQ